MKTSALLIIVATMLRVQSIKTSDDLFSIQPIKNNSGLFSKNIGPVHFLSRKVRIYLMLDWIELIDNLIILKQLISNTQKHTPLLVDQTIANIEKLDKVHHLREGTDLPSTDRSNLITYRAQHYLKQVLRLYETNPQATFQWLASAKTAVNILAALTYLPLDEPSNFSLRPFITEILNTSEIVIDELTPRKISTFSTGKSTTLTFELPVYNDTAFDLYRQFRFPLYEGNSTFTFVEPKSAHIAIHHSGTSHVFISPVELLQCFTILKTKFCNFVPNITTPECCKTILARNLTLEPPADSEIRLTDSPIWYELTTPNEILFSTKKERVHLSCPDHSREIPIHNAGILRFSPRCKLTRPKNRTMPWLIWILTLALIGSITIIILTFLLLTVTRQTSGMNTEPDQHDPENSPGLAYSFPSYTELQPRRYVSPPLITFYHRPTTHSSNDYVNGHLLHATSIYDRPPPPRPVLSVAVPTTAD